MRPSLHLHCAMHGITVVWLVGLAVVVTQRAEFADEIRGVRDPLLALAGIVLLLSLLYRHRAAVWFSTRLCVVLLTLAVGLSAGELFFRMVGYDFRQQEAAYRRNPPFHRQPRTPCGSVFFRRAGPETWTGQVVRTALRELRLDDSAWQNEPIVTVRYDQSGFRNEGPLSAWEIALAGDSFTELGYLPYEALFTTILAQRLDCRVRNLGVSFTGPLSQLCYLREYGVSPATKTAVIVFFEGNDLDDLGSEYRALRDYESTGQRPRRDVQAQTSLWRALTEWLHNPWPTRWAPIRVAPEAIYLAPEGEVPLTIGVFPPDEDLSAPTIRTALEFFLQEYAAWGRHQGIRPWLAYMPCKARVLHGKLRWTPQAPSILTTWKPGTLPQQLRGLCEERGMGFVDLTPALRAEVDRTGQLPFNALQETHLNARGSGVVADELARRLEKRVLVGP